MSAWWWIAQAVVLGGFGIFLFICWAQWFPWFTVDTIHGVHRGHFTRRAAMRDAEKQGRPGMVVQDFWSVVDQGWAQEVRR